MKGNAKSTMTSLSKTSADYAVETVQFDKIWQHLMHFKKLIVSFALGSAILSVALALYLTPYYTAEIIFVPAMPDGSAEQRGLAAQFGGIASLAGINMNADSSLDTNLGILKSREFTNQFIQDNNLLPVLFEDKWDTEKQQWTVEPESVPTLWDGYKVFHKRIREVSHDLTTNLVTMSVTWKDPELASNWANALVAKLNQHIREKDIEEAKKSIHYLEQQIQKTNIVRTKEILYGLLEKHIQTISLAEIRDEYAFTVIDPAVLPEEKSKPKRSLIVLAGTLLGTFLGFVIAFLSPIRQKP